VTPVANGFAPLMASVETPDVVCDRLTFGRDHDHEAVAASRRLTGRLAKGAGTLAVTTRPIRQAGTIG
jgi:hypothetical protein